MNNGSLSASPDPHPPSFPVLGIELRFRSGPPPETWLRVLQRILEWNPQLQPTTLYRNSDPQAEEPEPWTESLAPQVAQGLAGSKSFSWMLFRHDNEEQRLTLRRQGDEISASIALPWSGGDPQSSLLDLIERLQDIVPVALGMLFDAYSPEAEVILQGLGGLRDLPALLYLDSAAAAALGEPERLRRAPCPVIDAPGNGVLLVIRENPWGNPTPEQRARTRSVAIYLGITPGNPLKFTFS